MTSTASTTSTKGRPRFTAEKRELWLAAQREREASASSALVEGVSRMADVQGWRAWLDFAARLPKFSVSNQVLLARQCPAASSVMSASQWREVGRFPARGATALRIWAPRMASKAEREAMAAATGAPGNTAGGEQIARHPDGRPRYVLVPVFDVSQTDGDPLPAQPTPIAPPPGLAPAGMWEAMVSYAAARGFTVSVGDTGPADGLTHFGDHTITISPRGSALAQALTLAHEIGHMSLHAETASRDPGGVHRGRMEVAAESVAYLVAADFGLASAADWHFDYLAHWAARMGPDAAAATRDELRDTAGGVLAAARPLLEHLHNCCVGHPDPLAATTRLTPPPPTVEVVR